MVRCPKCHKRVSGWREGIWLSKSEKTLLYVRLCELCGFFWKERHRIG